MIPEHLEKVSQEILVQDETQTQYEAEINFLVWIQFFENVLIGEERNYEIAVDKNYP
jgi:hypothetical protein